MRRVLASNLEMDPYGPPRKRPRPESGSLNGSNGTNGGHGSVDDCKLAACACFFWGVRCQLLLREAFRQLGCCVLCDLHSPWFWLFELTIACVSLSGDK